MGQTIDIEQALDAIASALAAVVDEPGWKLAQDRVSAAALTAVRVRDGVEELASRLVAEVEARKIPTDAAASTTAWLQGQARLSRTVAGASVTHARAFAPDKNGVVAVEPTRHAWSSGAISTDHAMIIARAVNNLGDDVSAADKTLAEKVVLAEARPWASKAPATSPTMSSSTSTPRPPTRGSVSSSGVRSDAPWPRRG